MKAPQTNINRPLIEAGTHMARLVSIVDLGTQHSTFQGTPRTAHQIRLSWETPEVTAEFKEGEGQKPFLISRTFTFSMHEKAGLRKLIEMWRGKSFSNEEAANFDVEKLLGQSCLMTVIHAQSPDGTKTYANITALAKLMKGQTCPAQVNPSVLYQITDGLSETFTKLPEFLQKIIQDSVEFKTDTKAASPVADVEDPDWGA